MADTGAQNPTSAVNDGSGINWSNPTNVYSSNNVYATVACPARGVRDTSALFVTGFGFAIPAGSTIDGIKVDVERKKSTAAAGTTCVDNGITLTKDGSTGVGYTTDVNLWSTTEGYQTFGGATILWNTTWTVAEVNDTNFGFMFSASLVGSAVAGITASVDHVRITIYYTEAVTGTAKQWSLSPQTIRFGNESSNPLIRL